MKKKVLTAVSIFAMATIVNASEKVHTNQNKEEVACAKECYQSIRNLWKSGVITLEEAQKLWLEHKKNE
jgi:hypothetical protein